MIAISLIIFLVVILMFFADPPPLPYYSGPQCTSIDFFLRFFIDRESNESKPRKTPCHLPFGFFNIARQLVGHWT